MESNQKMLKTNKGITLIALIITIIVMLILVAVIISMAINGGLFGYAKKAKDETESAIEAEKRLADGKIKIDGKWYASIDDYLNNNPIITGIELNTSKIELKKKETTEAIGKEILTGEITANTYGMEKEPEITWEVTPADQTAVTLSATSGKSIKVTAVGTANATVTVIAKCIYEGETYSEKCKVSLEILKLVDKGSFIEYDVAYTDAYNDRDYTTTNGWRLLDYTPHEEVDGTITISNVKLISTGIPARLCFDYKTDYTNDGDWWVTQEYSPDPTVPTLRTFEEVTGVTCSYSSASQASAGMYYNFGDIQFDYGTQEYGRGPNLGIFTSITTGGINWESRYGEKTGNELFKARNDVTSVRLLTLKEVNEAIGRTDIDMRIKISETEDGIGLYRLDQLKNVTEMSNYTYYNGGYWLATPSDGVYKLTSQGEAQTVARRCLRGPPGYYPGV